MALAKIREASPTGLTSDEVYSVFLEAYAFSKRAANHTHMMAIYFMHYNFVRIHQTLKITPAMAAGITGKLWEMADVVKVLEDWETAQKRTA
jgi:hypothetical protein